ncbi:MAG TPA: hypothetical protein VN281_08600 [Verrucomicrobiae bacterium]|jgi:hypothetical protein|nr:hypothetical protein [Verrucomicrobiae bacterium]
MKTPREILFDRHLDAERRLDAIRERLLAEAFSGRASDRTPRGSLSLAGVIEKLWNQLIVPCRRIWCALAVVWLIIMALNLASADAPKTVRNKSIASSPEIRLAVREQRLLRLELLGASMSPAPPPGIAPPRSERRTPVMFA